MELKDLAKLHEDDAHCEKCEDCDGCILNRRIERVMDDYPFELPELTICQCFDLINLNCPED